MQTAKMMNDRQIFIQNCIAGTKNRRMQIFQLKQCSNLMTTRIHNFVRHNSSYKINTQITR